MRNLFVRNSHTAVCGSLVGGRKRVVDV